MLRSRPSYPPEFREQRLAGDLQDSRSEVAGNPILGEPRRRGGRSETIGPAAGDAKRTDGLCGWVHSEPLARNLEKRLRPKDLLVRLLRSGSVAGAVVADVSLVLSLTKMGVELRGQSATLGEVLAERGDHGRMLGEGETLAEQMCFGEIEHGVVGA